MAAQAPYSHYKNTMQLGTDTRRCLRAYFTSDWNANYSSPGNDDEEYCRWRVGHNFTLCPDHTIGFKWSTFSEEQRQKLSLDSMEKSFYTVRKDIHFSFLTNEVKCGKQALDLVDWPNVHSIAIATKGVFYLYYKISRPIEVRR